VNFADELQREVNRLDTKLEDHRKVLAELTGEYNQACKKLAAGEQVDLTEIRSRMQTATDSK